MHSFLYYSYHRCVNFTVWRDIYIYIYIYIYILYIYYIYIYNLIICPGVLVWSATRRYWRWCGLRPHLLDKGVLRASPSLSLRLSQARLRRQPAEVFQRAGREGLRRGKGHNRGTHRPGGANRGARRDRDGRRAGRRPAKVDRT